MSPATISVVIPMLDERAEVGRAIDSAWEAGASEVIVVDGGSRDGSQDAVLPPARLLTSPGGQRPGRARQIQAGIEASSGGIVVILHADSRLPLGADVAIRRAIEGGAVGGAFHKRFDSDHPLLRQVRWRTRLWWSAGLSFGDQAQFATREALRQLGSLRTDVPAEDLDLAMRLGRLGPTALLDEEVTTSARRLHEQGILRTWLRWWRIALGQIARERMRR